MSTDRRPWPKYQPTTNKAITDTAALAVKMRLEFSNTILFPLQDGADRAVAYMPFDIVKPHRRPFIISAKAPLDELPKTYEEYLAFVEPVLEHIDALGEFDIDHVYEMIHPVKGLTRFKLMPLNSTQFSNIITDIYKIIYGEIDYVCQAEVEAVDDPYFFDNHQLFYKHLN